MKKYILIFFTIMILAAVGLAVFNNLSVYRYTFATIWGAIMLTVSLRLANVF